MSARDRFRVVEITETLHERSRVKLRAVREGTLAPDGAYGEIEILVRHNKEFRFGLGEFYLMDFTLDDNQALYG